WSTNAGHSSGIVNAYKQIDSGKALRAWRSRNGGLGGSLNNTTGGGSRMVAPAITHPYLPGILGPLEDDAFGTGYSAGLEGIRNRELLKSTLAGIAPNENDLARRQALPGRAADNRPGSDGAPGSPPLELQKMFSFASRVDRKH